MSFRRTLMLLGVLMAMPAQAQTVPPAQIAAERHAMALLARADVRAAEARLAARWRAGSPGLLAESYAQLPAAIRSVAFMVALEEIDNDPRRPQVIEISVPPHRWSGTRVPDGRWGINNPDTLYFTVPVEPGSRYVLTGHRHAGAPTDANITLQTIDVWGAVDNIALGDLQVDADGTYRITIDDEPANGRPNHLQIRGGATQIIIRNTLADWAREVPDTLSVERIAGPPAAPVRGEEALAQTVIRRLGNVVVHSIDGLQPPIFRLPANVIPAPGALADKPGFLVTQRNALGHFRLADDEALVATFDPGGAGYATFPVTNVWGISPDSRAHQNSLNTAQAVHNPDGTITVVLAERDPGVANWIDPAGLHEGIVMLRWQRLAAGGRGPGVTAKVVKIADLPQVLPATVRRITPAERQRQKAARAVGFDRRFARRGE